MVLQGMSAAASLDALDWFPSGSAYPASTGNRPDAVIDGGDLQHQPRGIWIVQFAAIARASAARSIQNCGSKRSVDCGMVSPFEQRLRKQHDLAIVTSAMSACRISIF